MYVRRRPSIVLEISPHDVTRCSELRAMSFAARLDDVTVSFDGPDGERAIALERVSLDLKTRELLVLVGRSGSGKTTVLNVLAGLVTPTSGGVEVLGVPPIQARSRLGYMFARDALLPWRSAIANVRLGLELRSSNRHEIKKTSAEYLKLVHLEDYAARFPAQLSQGQRQRIALARTWATGPDLLLMDEPFSALDAQTREGLQNEFVRLWESQRCSALFVTHDLQEAITLADRILVFARGRIEAEFTVSIARPRQFMDTADGIALYRELRRLLESK